jgi:hypothetical protein
VLTTGQYQRLVLNLSDERDQWRRLAWQLWADGYAAAELARADDYARGLADGAYCRKRAQQDLVEAARLDLLRWGDAGREHFGDPRPGDFPGRGVSA